MSLLRQLRLLRAYALLTYPFACVPFLYLYFAGHGLSQREYGFVIGAYYVAMFVAEVPTGMLADRFGPKCMLVAGPLLLTSGFALLWAWPTLAGFTCGEALLGLGHAAISGAPPAMLYETLREHDRASDFLREEGRMHGLRLLGTGSSFLLGGVVAHAGGGAGGWAFGATIPLTCALTLAAAVAAVCLHAEPGRPVRPLRDVLAAIAAGLGHRPVTWLLLYWIVLFALLRYPFHNYQPYLADLAADAPLLGNPFVVGGLYAMLSIAAAPVSLHVPGLVRRYGRRTLFWAMPMLLAASLLVCAAERLAAADGVHSPWLPWLGVAMFFVQQVPFGTHWSLLQEFVNHRIDAAGRTSVLSALSLGARLCYAAVNVGLFALQDARGMAAAMGAAGGLGALAAAVVLSLRPVGLLADTDTVGRDGPAQRPRST